MAPLLYQRTAWRNATPLDGGPPAGQFRPMAERENRFMEAALTEARAAAARGEVPVGAVLVHGPKRQILARAGNRTEEKSDPTAHAEMLVIRQAGGAWGRPRLA